MSSNNQNSDNELTTDAVPSPSFINDERTTEEETVHDDDFSDKSSQFEETIRANVDSINAKKNRHSINSLTPTVIPGAYSPSRTTIININNSKDIHVGDTINYNLNNTVKSKVNTSVTETTSIKNMKACNDPVTREDLLLISGYMDENWKDVARSLDYSDSEIKQFIIDHNTYGVKEVIYQLLLDWIRSQPQKATVGLLSRVLWDKKQIDTLRKWSEERKH